MKNKTIIPDYLKAAGTASCVVFFILAFFLKTVRIKDTYSILYSTSYSQDITIFEMLNMNDGVGIHPNIAMVLWVLASCAAAIAFIWTNHKIGFVASSASLLLFMITTLYKNYNVDDVWSWKPYEGYYQESSQYRFMSFGKYYNSYYALWFVAVLIVTIAVLAFLINSNKEVPVSQPTDNKQSSLDDLIKFKELLDKGILTEEEFNAKKEELLGKE